MPLHQDLIRVLKKNPNRYRFRQKPVTELEAKRDDWGGLYVFSSTESLTSPWILPKGGPIFKVGMSKASIYRRLEGYTHPIMEVDGLVVRRSEAVIKAFAHQYATDCFNAKVPLDCYCERTLFRRHCAAKKVAKE